MIASRYLDASSLDLLIQAAKSLPWNPEREVSSTVLDFLTQVHSALDPSSLDDFRLDDIAAMARSFWEWGEVRQQGASAVRTRRALSKDGKELPHTLLEIIGRDMPFLVRSVTGACQDLNINPFLIIHPIVNVARDENGLRLESGSGLNESYIQIVLDLLDESACKTLEDEIRKTLIDVRHCVNDYTAMQLRMKHAAIDVASHRFGDDDTTREAAAFLNWLADEHFTFLGSRHYTFARLENGQLAKEEPEIVEGTSLGVLRDQDSFILNRGHEPTIINEQISDFLDEASPIIVSKGSMKSRVHRRVNVDYIGVKQYDASGQVVGEIRFAGLFTADAYNRMARDVPLVRQKVDRVLEMANKLPGSHDANALKHILETYPRDELFQISVDELFDIANSILQLQSRTETRVFVRKDRFERFISALVYVPKESFNSDLRARIGRVLCRAYDGELTAFYPQYGDAPLARIHFLIDLKEGHAEPSIEKLEQEISKLARSWNDQMRSMIRLHRAELTSNLNEDMITGAFNAAYKESFDPSEALTDVQMFSGLSEARPVVLRAYRHDDDPTTVIRAKIYTLKFPIELSTCVPVFEHMGLFVSSETGYRVFLDANTDEFWVHDVKMKSADDSDIHLHDVRTQFEEAFEAAWTGRTESDGFNKLVMAIGASWREAALFRTLARYRKQTGLDPAQTTQILALTTHPRISELLLQCFRIRFDPDLELSIDVRKQNCVEIAEEINEALDQVASLDEDRVLRRISELIHAILRTNFYQLNENGEPHSHIAIKIASRELESLPAPKPFREIFVWAPHVEGVHLRFGPVARGGLRWSDRRDDFRTEVLGLVKAQQVKNAVIVPVGSKGGFYPKSLPKSGNRDAVLEEGIRAYKTFILAMLQLTDNLVGGEPRHPGRTVIWDGADPYLVVAADKGTATFSDIANEISTSLGFWLGDAFASGGSVGYDHKKMGITARGGWVAVQRHFREAGVNVQTDPFSVIGVGDMSGDVFGNGMLLSKTIQLKAAFNHMHIFLDPEPVDALTSWAERKRMFELPRSSWSDYNPELISKGGGIFPRSAKRIELTPEIQAFLGSDAPHLTPNELIQAILKAKADLLWFGGIGTYVKSSAQSHLDVGDKANDAIRVNADELNVNVIGEGANLGLTQAGRIAFAKLGGRINTDAIDNSAGVDSSDHEVNIKILLQNAIETGALEQVDRNDLLASMTDDVGNLVLVHNYDQTGALSIAEASADQDLDSHERMMERLEAAGILDRTVEGLPKPEEIRVLRESGGSLTRPELAVLLAYAKITLFDELIASSVPDDDFLKSELYAYFPEPLYPFKAAMETHRLKREIIATRLANDMINLGGITFVHRVRERAGTETGPIARAFVAANEVFRLGALLSRIDGLDNKVPASIQTRMRTDLINALRRQVFWLAKTRPANASIRQMVDQYAPGAHKLLDIGVRSLSPFEHDLLEQRVSDYVDAGAPDEIAFDVALVQALTSATDIVDLAEREHRDVACMAMLFNAVGAGFQFDRLREAALSLSLNQHWDRLAVRGLVETLLGQQFTLAARISTHATDEKLSDFGSARSKVDEFLGEHVSSYERLTLLLAEIEQAGAWTFAKLVLVANAIRSFIDETESRTI